MPNPSQVTAQDINTELGVPTTTSIKMSNNWVKNIASTGSTSNTNVNYGKVRWGINFPGRDVVINGAFGSNTAKYSLDNELTLFSSDVRSIYDSFSIVQAGSQITLYSNGLFQVMLTTTQTGGYIFNRTWLTSGANTDYTAQFQLTSGTLSGTSSDSNTDLGLDTTRQWLVVTPQLFGSGGDQSNTRSAAGNLIIKSGTTTLIDRPVTFYAEAVLGPL